ncbi:MAG: DUF6157 family protein [Myxococcota bacterium]
MTKQHTTNYTDTFITVAADCPETAGVPPRETAKPSVALRTFKMLVASPYRYTSDEVIFEVFADRKGIPKRQRAAARREFFSKGQPCLRASDLGKRYGWGIHFDSEGRAALYGVESSEYRKLAKGQGPDRTQLEVRRAMRSRR